MPAYVPSHLGDPIQMDLWVTPGMTLRKQWTWKNPDGSIIDISGYAARAQARRSKDTVAALFSVTENYVANEGQVILGGVLGTITLYLPDTKTDDLVVGGIWGLSLITPGSLPTGGDKFPFFEGVIKLKENVIR